jgi:hypothetical protein
MSLQELMNGYAKIHNLPGLPLDANQMCRLRFGDSVVVDIEPSKLPGQAHLYAVLGRAPQNPGESYFRKLLEWNLFGRDTGGASLACDPETEDLLLWRLIDIDSLTAERFDATLRELVQSAGRLMEKLKGDTVTEAARSEDSVLMNTFYVRA